VLRMDGFGFVPARSPEEAVALVQDRPDAVFLAGGTDLLPNLKHRIVRPRTVIGLGGALPAGWSVGDGVVTIGAGTTLRALSGLSALPSLAAAAGCVAGPQIRNMGTLGGNVLLDTRCLYYNQTAEWRKALGHCLKAEGTWCHVVGGPKTCVATQSSDTVPVLLSLGATLRFLGPAGERRLPIRDLYRFNGMDHLKLEKGEVLTHVEVPLPAAGTRASYQKLRTRGSIDFPQLSVAIRGTFEGAGPSAMAPDLEVVIGAVNPQPKAIAGIDALAREPLSDAVIAEISATVVARTRPQGSVHGDVGWRRQMAGVLVSRALHRLRAGAAVPAEGA